MSTVPPAPSGSETAIGVVVSIDKILDAWGDGVESEIAASKIAFAIENPWRWHVCRRGRLWRKRARSDRQIGYERRTACMKPVGGNPPL